MKTAANYQDIYKDWQDNSSRFWLNAAEDLHWYQKPSQAFFPEEGPIGVWFADGMTNTCYNAVDRHVEAGRGHQNAIIWDSPVSGGATEAVTFSELQSRVAALAGALKAQGVEKGDRVLIYMSMVPSALVAMLACARIGAVHSVVFGGFAASELTKRIDDAKPKAILATSAGIEPGRVISYKPLIDAAIDRAAHKPAFTVIYQRDVSSAELGPQDYDWHEFVANATPAAPEPMAGRDPLYILYTSGTTGKPKGVVRDIGGHQVALHWSMKHVYNVDPGDVFWAASDIGWVVGHSYICYAPLLAGNTTVMFEGKPVGTPDTGAFWRVIEDHNVKALFTAPTAFRAIKRQDPKGEALKDYDISALQTLFLAGERADPDTVKWAENLLNVPVIDHWWQTETGWAICANPMGVEALPVPSGSPGVAMPGYQVDILDEDGHVVSDGELGAIAIKLPLAPGNLPTLWQDEERFFESYLKKYPGYYVSGDAGYKDVAGHVFVMSRADDVINVAGHRLSTGGIEEAIANHPDVGECAVVGVHDEIKGQVPLALICLKTGASEDGETIAKQCIERVRDEIGAIATPKRVVPVDRLPKTRSGKILRRSIVQVAQGEDYIVPATIDDPAILEKIKSALNAKDVVA